MEETEYAALTGDLVASKRRAPDFRATIQKEALQVLTELNEKLGDHLARPLVLTAGDEIQGLFHTPSSVVEAVQVIKDRLFGSAAAGQEIVFGIGRGPLSTGLLPEARSVEQLDGPCFHQARAMLQRAKKQKVWAVFGGFGETEDEVLNSLFELMGAIRAGWTTTQSLYIQDLRELGKRILVASRRGVSPSVVTESLQLSRFRAIENGEETARSILRQFDPITPPS